MACAARKRREGRAWREAENVRLCAGRCTSGVHRMTKHEWTDDSSVLMKEPDLQRCSTPGGHTTFSFSHLPLLSGDALTLGLSISVQWPRFARSVELLQWQLCAAAAVTTSHSPPGVAANTSTAASWPVNHIYCQLVGGGCHVGPAGGPAVRLKRLAPRPQSPCASAVYGLGL